MGLRDASERIKKRAEELKEEVKETCQEFIYQKGSTIKQLPERTRLVFSIRESVQDFINTYIKTIGATVNEEELAKVAEQVSDISVQNMAKAVLQIVNCKLVCLRPPQPHNLKIANSGYAKTLYANF